MASGSFSLQHLGGSLSVKDAARGPGQSFQIPLAGFKIQGLGFKV